MNPSIASLVAAFAWSSRVRPMWSLTVVAVWSLPTLAASPTGLLAQHEHAASPYAEIDIDEATSLPVEDVAGLRAGEGLGMALQAELAGYPGPMHALELASRLELSPAQTSSLENVRRRMTEAAVTKGAEVLAAEAELAELFRSGRAEPQDVEVLSLVVGRLRGELRAIHLAAHLETHALLSEEQVRMYDRHRGYAPR